MNGPVECLKKLLCMDAKYCPQRTFLGLRDEWMEKTEKHKYLYKTDAEIASTIGYKFGLMQITLG